MNPLLKNPLLKNPLLVAFQGEAGAYSELAALEYFPEPVQTLPCRSFDEVFERVLKQECSHGIIPIENSLAGSIHRNYDLMLHHELHIVGEYHLRVNHCLLALPGVKLEEVRIVHSHPQALAQCEQNLNRLGVEIASEYDTAGSARLLRERADRNAGALASRRAAEVYGLQILAEAMEDNRQNFTRFLALSLTPYFRQPSDEREFKTSIVFSLENRPGALFKALGVFALRDIDLTKIESRPIPGSPWDYMFYIDFAGHIDETNCRRALDNLQEITTFFRVLGSYPRHRMKFE